MIKFRSILAFGDSNVAGCEAVPELEVHYRKVAQGQLTIQAADDHSKRFSFANQLAEKLGIPCYNFAMSGGSNSRSLRILTREILNYPDSLVLFGYTCTDRKEFYYPDPGFFYARDNDNFMQTGIQWERHDAEFNKVARHPINKLFVDKISRPYNDLREVMFCVDSICRLYARGLIHIPLFAEKIPREFKNIFDFEGLANYYDWGESKGYVFTDRFHFDYRAHDALADLLMKYLFINYQDARKGSMP
jgi:hypothetical protein